MVGVYVVFLRVEWVEGYGWFLSLFSLLVRWLISVCDELGVEIDDRTYFFLVVIVLWLFVCGSKRFIISLIVFVILFYYSRFDR